MKNTLIKNSFFLFFLFSVNHVFSQKNEQSDIIEITGRVINQTDGRPVRFASIINLHRGACVTGDSLGFFHFTLMKSDYLRISSMGYYPLVINFSDSTVFDPTAIYTVRLVERNYYLPVVDIFAARWNEFKFDFSRVPIKNEDSKNNIQLYILSLVDKEELAMIVASKSVGFELPFTSNRQKQLNKIAELEQKDALDQICEERYNKQLVARVTGLKGSELDNFVAYCDIDKAYILRSNDYDIILKINKMYDVYKSSKQVEFH